MIIIIIISHNAALFLSMPRTYMYFIRFFVLYIFVFYSILLILFFLSEGSNTRHIHIYLDGVGGTQPSARHSMWVIRVLSM